LNTNHHELYLSADDIISAVPMISSIFDEPFADSSQLPTYFVCKLAKNNANVVLSGDAGDEIFGGYNRYIQAGRFFEFPQIVRKVIGNSLSQFSPSQVDAIYSFVECFLPKSIRTSNAGNHYSKIIALLAQSTDWDLYQSLISTSSNPQAILKNIQSNFGVNNITQNIFRSDFQIENKMMQSDAITYLPDDVLCKVDRSSMAVSLECRVPFLDHNIIEFAQKLPLNMKIRNGQGKWILRQILNRYVPYQLIDRPKMGFGIPLDIWLRGPLRDYAESMFREKDLNEFLDPVGVYKLWSEHLSCKKNHQHILWNILMFQSWKKEWL
jgi:asparagine synthase (glutamine-hydrolysing)